MTFEEANRSGRESVVQIPIFHDGSDGVCYSHGVQVRNNVSMLAVCHVARNVRMGQHHRPAYREEFGQLARKTIIVKFAWFARLYQDIRQGKQPGNIMMRRYS